MKQRFKIQTLSNSSHILYNQNITTSQNKRYRMKQNGGSLARKYNFCNNCGVKDVNECLYNPNCCMGNYTNWTVVKGSEEVIYTVIGVYYIDTSNNIKNCVVTQVNEELQPTVKIIYPTESGPIQGAILNLGIDSQIFVSASSYGNAVIGGNYTDTTENQKSFVTSQVNGGWLNAQPVTFSGNVFSQSVNSISASSPGNAIAGGNYNLDKFSSTTSFVLNQVGGKWSQAQNVLFPIDISGSNLTSISSSSTGNGVAGGYIIIPGKDNPKPPVPDPRPKKLSIEPTIDPLVPVIPIVDPGPITTTILKAFVVNQEGGIWSQAQFVSFPIDFSQSQITCISASSTGYAVAGGSYSNSNFSLLGKPFVVNQNNGEWSQAKNIVFEGEIIYAIINSISASSPGNAVAGGIYAHSGTIMGHDKAFVVNQVEGIWSLAQDISFSNTSVNVIDFFVSASSSKNAVAGGTYIMNPDSKFSPTTPFVVNQVNGQWSVAEDVLFSNTIDSARIHSISASSPGNAVAVGNYLDPSGSYPFFINQVNGQWQQPAQKIVLPDDASLNDPQSIAYSVSSIVTLK
jgi:hypothetical protein